MSRRLIMSSLLALIFYQPALAFEARELSQDEIRSAVASANSLSPRRILDTVSKRVAGEIVDVRMFDANGLCYRVLLVLPTGKLASVVVDAVTGDLLAGNSQRASSVTVAARSNPGRAGVIKRKQKVSGTGSANANPKDNGNGGNGSGNNGNGGGNSGGGNSGNGGGNNGGGNSGGGGGNNGGGNSGGGGGNNGGGNSGGGGGNSGGGGGNSGGGGKK